MRTEEKIKLVPSCELRVKSKEFQFIMTPHCSYSAEVARSFRSYRTAGVESYITSIS